MPHYPKPFFVKARRVWRVQIDGRQFKLCEGTEANRERAEECAALLKRRLRETVHAELVLGIIAGFLTWVEKHRSALTYRWYKDRLESFVRSLEAPTSMTVDRTVARGVCTGANASAVLASQAPGAADRRRRQARQAGMSAECASKILDVHRE